MADQSPALKLGRLRNKMNLANIITQTDTQQMIAESFIEVLNEFFKVPIKLLSKQIIYEPKNVDVKCFCLLRFMQKVGANFVLIGTEDMFTYKLLNALERAEKSILQDLLIESLKKSIISCMPEATPAASVYLLYEAIEEQIGFLKKVRSSRMLRCSFSFKDTQLIFDIPLKAREYEPGTVFKKIGFGEFARILIIDDSKLNRMILKNYLSAMGFLNVDEAIDGKNAIQIIDDAERCYDLIIADWHMPNLNGIDVLMEVRATDGPARITPFILATSAKNKEEILQAVEYKASGYLIKPYTADKLFDAMKVAKRSSEDK
jgi:two-component system chemotaxis response regulator CheY